MSDDEFERVEVAVIGSAEPVVFRGKRKSLTLDTRIEEMERRLAELERQANYTRTNAYSRTTYQVTRRAFG
jgi:hypothetical protein